MMMVNEPYGFPRQPLLARSPDPPPRPPHFLPSEGYERFRTHLPEARVPDVHAMSFTQPQTRYQFTQNEEVWKVHTSDHTRRPEWTNSPSVQRTEWKGSPMIPRSEWTVTPVDPRKDWPGTPKDPRSNWHGTPRGHRSDNIGIPKHPRVEESKYLRVENSGQFPDKRGALPSDEGPFVFGVDGPGRFFPGNSPRDDSQDYAEVKSVIEEESENLYCDKKIRIKPSNRQEEETKQMFKIDDKRNRAKKEERRKHERKKVREKIKCVLVGDGAVGKTSLISAYAQNLFLTDYKPTTFDNYNVVVEVDGRPICVELCDTAGQDSKGLKGLRELCYPGTDVILLCFSVVKPESFKAVATCWASAVENIRAPLLLVGTQADLRDCPETVRKLKSECKSPVSEAEARMLAAKLNAPYIETSSKTRSRLKDAFDSAILAALPVKQKKKPFWKKLFCLS